MSEAAATPEREPTVEPTGPSFGRQLTNAREALSLSVNDIAARLRLNPKQVMAIEREDLAALPEPAFIRGFVRNYAKEVRIDPVPLLDSLNRLLEPAAAAVPSPVQPTLLRTGGGERVSRNVVIIGAIGALVLFAVIGWIASPRSRHTEPAAAKPDSVSVSPAAPGPASSAVASPAPAEAAPPVEPGTLRFAFNGLSWVEVTQQDGRVLLSQNNPAGSEQIVHGRPPYWIVIGNAPAVALEYDGKPVDLTPVISAGNVARLTLQ